MLYTELYLLVNFNLSNHGYYIIKPYKFLIDIISLVDQSDSSILLISNLVYAKFYYVLYVCFSFIQGNELTYILQRQHQEVMFSIGQFQQNQVLMSEMMRELIDIQKQILSELKRLR